MTWIDKENDLLDLVLEYFIDLIRDRYQNYFNRHHVNRTMQSKLKIIVNISILQKQNLCNQRACEVNFSVSFSSLVCTPFHWSFSNSAPILDNLFSIRWHNIFNVWSQCTSKTGPFVVKSHFRSTNFDWMSMGNRTPRWRQTNRWSLYWKSKTDF